ncbi:actin cytoskeleton-regulatory complex protein PAN1 isoform X2 [Drosophila grimshawi]|uniref:actin cytoskeleton-regulatory complex protein PAN1 isoform X2 n=1 Tax=Drosophila grimshawi TaxID=7222 RepID=UPI000C86F5D3|nr:actin cytoskeleton-regulatory complex protein PAN1 isoform X2 [Drosophila grimshawi]
MSGGIVIGLCLAFIMYVIITVVLYMKRDLQASSNVGHVISEAPVVVTSATHTAPGGYPVTQIPATTYQPNTYGTPYPAQTTGNVSVQQMPMPMPGVPMPGMQPNVVAYPPMPMPQPGAGAANMNPPTYDMAMANSGPSVMPGGYEKQSPYNPNYAQ